MNSSSHKLLDQIIREQIAYRRMQINLQSVDKYNLFEYTAKSDYAGFKPDKPWSKYSQVSKEYANFEAVLLSWGAKPIQMGANPHAYELYLPWSWMPNVFDPKLTQWQKELTGKSFGAPIKSSGDYVTFKYDGVMQSKNQSVLTQWEPMGNKIKVLQMLPSTSNKAAAAVTSVVTLIPTHIGTISKGNSPGTGNYVLTKKGQEQIEIKQQIQKSANKKDTSSEMSQKAHTLMDWLGFVPVIGDAVDMVNGLWHLAEGHIVDAFLSFIAMIPVVGSAISSAFKGLYKITTKTGMTFYNVLRYMFSLKTIGKDTAKGISDLVDYVVKNKYVSEYQLEQLANGLGWLRTEIASFVNKKGKKSTDTKWEVLNKTIDTINAHLDNFRTRLLEALNASGRRGQISIANSLKYAKKYTPDMNWFTRYGNKIMSGPRITSWMAEAVEKTMKDRYVTSLLRNKKWLGLYAKYNRKNLIPFISGSLTKLGANINNPGGYDALANGLFSKHPDLLNKLFPATKTKLKSGATRTVRNFNDTVLNDLDTETLSKLIKLVTKKVGKDAEHNKQILAGITDSIKQSLGDDILWALYRRNTWEQLKTYANLPAMFKNRADIPLIGWIVSDAARLSKWFDIIANEIEGVVELLDKSATYRNTEGETQQIGFLKTAGDWLHFMPGDQKQSVIQWLVKQWNEEAAKNPVVNNKLKEAEQLLKQAANTESNRIFLNAARQMGGDLGIGLVADTIPYNPGQGSDTIR